MPNLIDAWELARPVLSVRGRRGGSSTGNTWGKGRRLPLADDVVEDRLRRARRLSSQLPTAAGDARNLPGHDLYRLTLHRIEDALAVTGATPGAAPGLAARPGAADMARRLSAEGRIAAPAADAVAALVDVLAAGSAGQIDDPSVETAAAQIGARLTAYLRSHAG